VVIGAGVVLLQVLYSQVYPYLEQNLQGLAQPLSDLVSKTLPSGVPDQDAVASPAAATEVLGRQQERQKKQGRRQEHALTEDDLEQAVAHRLMPHMSSVVQAFKAQGSVDKSAANGGLDVVWDAHRITDAEVPWAYLFRVTVKNPSPRPCPLQGLARFYVLRAPDGQGVFPIHRVTAGGPASFIVNAREQYRYAWIFFTKYKTLEAAGGLLLENRTKEEHSLEKRFLNTTLASLEPAKAQSIKSEKVQALIQGYNWMGVVDLRDVTYI
jgi:hypothetical protein